MKERVMAKESKTKQVIRYLAAHPDATARQVAEALKCKPHLVYHVKHLLRKEAPVGPLPPTPEPKSDMVRLPSHYTAGGVETIDYIKAKLTPEEFRGYCRGSALKYLSRAGKKGDYNEDAAKAAWFTALLSALCVTQG